MVQSFGEKNIDSIKNVEYTQTWKSSISTPKYISEKDPYTWAPGNAQEYPEWHGLLKKNNPCRKFKHPLTREKNKSIVVFLCCGMPFAVKMNKL